MEEQQTINTQSNNQNETTYKVESKGVNTKTLVLSVIGVISVLSLIFLGIIYFNNQNNINSIQKNNVVNMATKTSVSNTLESVVKSIPEYGIKFNLPKNWKTEIKSYSNYDEMYSVGFKKGLFITDPNSSEQLLIVKVSDYTPNPGNTPFPNVLYIPSGENKVDLIDDNIKRVIVEESLTPCGGRDLDDSETKDCPPNSPTKNLKGLYYAPKEFNLTSLVDGSNLSDKITGVNNMVIKVGNQSFVIFSLPKDSNLGGNIVDEEKYLVENKQMLESFNNIVTSMEEI